jgi:hypothetical protein
MHESTRQIDDTARKQQDAAVLEKYALRWAVLAAWRTDLAQRAAVLPPDVLTGLETSRIKISSGCFSSCEVGCDLRRIEATLTAVDASSPNEQTDKWLALLGRVMAERLDASELLSVPAVRIRFNDCRVGGCACSG